MCVCRGVCSNRPTEFVREGSGVDLFNEPEAWASQLERELSAKWPKALSERLDVLCAELKRSGMAESQAARLARRLTMAQAHYMGGRAYYIPTGRR